MHAQVGARFALAAAAVVAIGAVTTCQGEAGNPGPATSTVSSTASLGGSGGLGPVGGTMNGSGELPCPSTTIPELALDQGADAQLVPKIETNGSYGVTWVAWYSQVAGGYELRLQRVDLEGVTQLGDHGLLVSAEPTDPSAGDFALVADQGFSAVVALSDGRSGHPDVVANRFAWDGTPLWGTDGVALAPSPLDGLLPRAVATDLGDLVFAWERFDASGSVHEIVLQRVTPDGAMSWGDGIVLQGQGGMLAVRPQLVSAGVDVIVVWEETPDPASTDRSLWARRIDPLGAPRWGADTLVSSGQQLSALSDPVLQRGLGTDLYVMWPVIADGVRQTAYAQRLDIDGAPSWPTGGVPISTSPTTQQLHPRLSWDLSDDDGVVIAWVEANMSETQHGIFAQRVTVDGAAEWPTTGLEVVPLSDTQVDVAAVRKSGNAAMLFLSEQSLGNGSDVRILAGRLDFTASPAWDPQVLSGLQGSKPHLAVSSRAVCGYWMAWQDLRADPGDIYAASFVP